MTESRSTGTGGLLAAGIVVLIVAVLTAAGLWYSAGQRYDDAVRNLARAPVGCVTTLDFDEPGDYLLFLETQGRLRSVIGDCGVSGPFEWTGIGDPTVGVELTDPLGADVVLTPDNGASYDRAGSIGRSVFSFSADAGDHLLTVSGDRSVAVSVGRDPGDGVGMIRAGAALAAVVGLILGGGLLLAASRRRPPPGNVVPPPGPWGVGAPTGPPTVPQNVPFRPVVGPPTQPVPSPPLQSPPAKLPPPPPTPPNAPDGSGRSPWAAPEDGRS